MSSGIVARPVAERGVERGERERERARERASESEREVGEERVAVKAYGMCCWINRRCGFCSTVLCS